MILKYRTSSLTSPPHSSFSYIDNISHITPFYNPTASTLTVHLTLRNTPYPIPTTLVLNDLAFLLTDDGKFLDKLFAPTSKSHYPTYSDEDIEQPTSNYKKPYRPYKPYRPNFNNKPYYKNRNHTSINSTNHSNYSTSQEEQDNWSTENDSIEEE